MTRPMSYLAREGTRNFVLTTHRRCAVMSSGPNRYRKLLDVARRKEK
jgi:hypothetical protein